MRMELSFEAEMNRVFCLGWMHRDVTVLECPPNEWIILRCCCIFHTNMCPKKVDVMKYLNSSEMIKSVM